MKKNVFSSLYIALALLLCLTPILGLPGCVMYAKATIFDLVLPRIAGGVTLTRGDFVKLGHGGLCLGCEICHYPNCSFAKG